MKFSDIKHKTIAIALMVGTALPAMAAEGDPDLTKVTAAAASVALVGAAVFAVKVGIKLFKWMQAAL